jgi:hypothetical protein
MYPLGNSRRTIRLDLVRSMSIDPGRRAGALTAGQRERLLDAMAAVHAEPATPAWPPRVLRSHRVVTFLSLPRSGG